MQIVRNSARQDHVPPDRQHPVVVSVSEQRDAATGPREANAVVRAGRRRSPGNGHNAPLPVSRGPLEPSDFAQMAVLGIVHEGFRRFGEIVPAAKSLARPDWQPTADVLASALDGAVDEGYLASARSGFTLTRSGRMRLAALVRAPVESARGRTARTATALKVCFLRAVDDNQRDIVIDELAQLQKGELRTLLEGCAACPASGRCTRLWIAREIERIRSEINWLDTLKHELGRAG